MKKPIIGIALGGGGALGMAHIGVLKALEENNIVPDIIVGTSMGAVIGGVYASGKSIVYMEDVSKKIRTHNIYDVNFNPSGVLSGRSAERLLKKILGNDILIEEMPKKFACVATNLTTCNQKIFSKGSLIESIRASIAVPGVFTPLIVDNNCYVDGGVLNNVPVDVVKNLGADIVIGVNLVSDFEPYTSAKTIIHSVAFSFFLMQKELTKLKLKDYDFLIEPKLKEHRQYTFNKENTTKLIEIGYKTTIEQINNIKLKINNYNS